MDLLYLLAKLVNHSPINSIGTEIVTESLTGIPDLKFASIGILPKFQIRVVYQMVCLPDMLYFEIRPVTPLYPWARKLYFTIIYRYNSTITAF